MKITPVAPDDLERLKALSEYSILDALPENDFRDIQVVASSITRSPATLVSINDVHGNWFRSGFGLEVSEIPGSLAFVPDTPHLNEGIFILPDLSADPGFQSFPFVKGKPNITFFAAIPLVTPDEFVLGALCVFHYKTMSLTIAQIEGLKKLGNQIVTQLELRKKILRQEHRQDELKRAYADLEKFSHIVSHDLKSPLNNIISLTHLLKDDYGTKLDDEGNEYITFLNVAAYQLSDLVSAILNYSKASQMAVELQENVVLDDLIDEVVAMLSLPENADLHYPRGKQLFTSKIALRNILLHLLHNAVKYNDKDHVIINIDFSEDKFYYIFSVHDNGVGIDRADHEKIFELFERLHKKKDGESMGIGLAVVKRLVEKLGGSIKVTTEKPDGATFVFTIAKQ